MALDRQTLLSHSLQNARRFAVSQNVANPELWLDRADEISDLISLADAGSRTELVTRMIRYASAEVAALSEIGRVMSAGGDVLDRPPMPILQGLSSAARFGLSIMGAPATDTIMGVYNATSRSAIDRLFLLEALSCIADPRLNTFFEQLFEEDLVEPLRTQARIINSILDYYPRGDTNSLSEPDENEIVGQAGKNLLRLKQQHLEAMSL